MSTAQSGIQVLEPPSITPVDLLIQGDHAYKNRGARKSGCGHLMPSGKPCMKAMDWRGHLSHPISLNVFLKQGGVFEYRKFKAAWEELICEQLEASGLPAGWREDASPGTPRITLINAETLVCFPIHRGRDAGNFRWFVEKCLGDALSSGYSWSEKVQDPEHPSSTKKIKVVHVVNPGGWIEDDTIHPVRRFDHGGLDIVVRPNEAWTRITLFPS